MTVGRIPRLLSSVKARPWLLMTIALAAVVSFGLAALGFVEPGIVLFGVTGSFCVGWLLPRTAFAAYVVAATCSGLQVALGPANVRVDLIAFPLLIGAMCTVRSSEVAAPQWRPSWQMLVAIGGWLGAGFISSLFLAPSPTSSLWIWLQQAIAVGVYVIVGRTMSLRRDLYILATKVFAATLAVFIVSYLIWPPAVGMTSETGVIDSRLVGWSFEPNVLAAQCVGWLALSYYWRVGRARILWVCDGVVLLALILAGTRSAWLAAGVLLVVVIVNEVRSRTKSPLPLTLGLLGALTSIGAASAFLVAQFSPNSELGKRLLSLVDLQDGTGAYRLDIYRTAITDMMEPWRWLVGSGMNSYSQFHPIDATNVTSEYLSTVWLAIPYDSGLIGLAGFIWLIWLVFRSAARPLDAVLLLVVIFICATTTNTFWFGFVWLLLAITSDRYEAARSETLDGKVPNS